MVTILSFRFVLHGNPGKFVRKSVDAAGSKPQQEILKQGFLEEVTDKVAGDICLHPLRMHGPI